MKRRNRSILALLLLAALLVSTLTGCFRADDAPNEDGSDSDTLTNEIDQQTEAQPYGQMVDGVFVFANLIPMSSSLKAEVEATFYQKHNREIPWSSQDMNTYRYYGIHSDCVVMMKRNRIFSFFMVLVFVINIYLLSIHAYNPSNDSNAEKDYGSAAY